VHQRLQAQLPEEFALAPPLDVPVSGPSLSQELVAASWWLELTAAATPGSALVASPASQDWHAAAAALLASDSWIWHDTDKKGRPRSRECRPDLLDLSVQPDRAGVVAVTYSAAIDAAGRSLRPEQLQHWFQQRLGVELALLRLRRQSLQLRQS
jgi:hypothetical protein